MKFLNNVKGKVNRLTDILVCWISVDASRALRVFVWSLVGVGLVSWLVGLVVFGWFVWPVKWTHITFNILDQEYQEMYVTAVSDLFTFKQNPYEVKYLLGGWGGDGVACQLADEVSSLEEKARLIRAAFAVNGHGCP